MVLVTMCVDNGDCPGLPNLLKNHTYMNIAILLIAFHFQQNAEDFYLSQSLRMTFVQGCPRPFFKAASPIFHHSTPTVEMSPT